MSEVSIETFEPATVRDSGLFMANIDDLKQLIRFGVFLSAKLSLYQQGLLFGNMNWPQLKHWQQAAILLSPVLSAI